MEKIVATSLKELEDKLYIYQELTPESRQWRYELEHYAETTFTYHDCEYVRVIDLGRDNLYALLDE